MSNFVGFSYLNKKPKEKTLKKCQWENCNAGAKMLYCKVHSYDAMLRNKKRKRQKGKLWQRLNKRKQ